MYFEGWTREDWEEWYAAFGEDFDGNECAAGNEVTYREKTN